MDKEKATTKEDTAAEAKRKQGLVRGFGQFIQGYGVIPLAVGVVIGNAVNDFVKDVVADLVSPLISLVSPEGKLQNFQFHLHGSVFKVGHVLNSFISFLVIALVVYLVVRLILRNEDLLKK